MMAWMMRQIAIVLIWLGLGPGCSAPTPEPRPPARVEGIDPHELATHTDNHSLNSVALEPSLPVMSARGRLRVDGLLFWNEFGDVVQSRAMDEFRLYERFLNREDIDAILTDHLTRPDGSFFRPEQGPNEIRVFGMVNSFGHLWPQERGDYYARLKEFAAKVAARGLYIEFVVFADAQIVMPNEADKLRHLNNVVENFKDSWNVKIEVANEAYKNMPGGYQEAVRLGRQVQGRGLVIAASSVEGNLSNCTTSLDALDYATLHTARTTEWPRTARSLADIRDGFDWGRDCGGARFAGLHRPVLGNEPVGFAEQESGGRSTSSDDAAYFAGTCGLMSAGCTFHSDAGIQSAPLGPVQRAALEQFMFALAWVPKEASVWAYERGGSQPGCRWVGDSTLEHDDAQELRSYQKGPDASTKWVIQIRTRRQAPVTCPGWRVESSPRRGFFLVRRSG
jgi:hypothetical protein